MAYPKKKSLSPDQQKQLVAMYDQGVYVRYLVKQFGISQRYFYKIMARHRRSRSQWRIPPDVVAGIVEKYNRGVSISVIARVLHVSLRTVTRTAMRQGCKMRGPCCKAKPHSKITETAPCL